LDLIFLLVVAGGFGFKLGRWSRFIIRMGAHPYGGDIVYDAWRKARTEEAEERSKTDKEIK